MRRRLLVACVSAVTILAVMAAGGTGVSACGDKFLRFGRSARMKPYAAIHPAAILVFVPATADPRKVKEFEATLKRAGHRPLSVRGIDGVTTAMAGERYDIVIAIEPDADRLVEHFANAPVRPQVLPISDKAKAAFVELQRKYPYVLRAGATRNEMLAEIDRAMKTRVDVQP